MDLGTLAALCLVGAVASFLLGGVLYAPIGSAVTSGASGDSVLSGIAQSGDRFAIVNVLFHLTPLLILPAMVALFRDLSTVRPGEVAIGTIIGLIAFGVPMGVIFPLNVSLARLAARYRGADAPTRAMLALAAEANLGTQVGGEFVQSAFGGVWVLAGSAAMLAAPAWPAWLGYVGLAAGAGMIAAGFASVFARIPRLGRILGFVGFGGLLVLMIWLLGVASRLLVPG